VASSTYTSRTERGARLSNHSDHGKQVDAEDGKHCRVDKKMFVPILASGV